MSSRDQQSEDFLNSGAIDDSFFIDIIERKLNISRDQFKLRLVLLSPATGKNENYVSVLYRAKIKIEMIETGEKKTTDVIIKALLTTLKEMKEFSVFPRERFMYEDVLKSFEDIWLDRAGEEIQFGPRDIKYETDPYEIIVLDDLKAAGYEMLNRKVGLNMEQTKMLLRKLAKFHAASAVRYQKDGIIQDHFDRSKMPLFPEDGPLVDGFRKMSKTFEDSIRNYGGFEDISDKISQWNMRKLLMAFMEVAKPMRCGFQILNHGDIWLNNMMFKFDEERNSVVDVRMIDYQMSFWGSPSADLLYFLLSSVEDDIKVDHFDEFIDFYHEYLTKSLKMLQYDQHIPTLTELHIDLLEKGFFACSCITGILCVVKYDSEEEINMEMFLSGEDNSEKLFRIYNNDNFKKALKLWIPFLNKRGYFDTLLGGEEKKIEE